MSGDASSGPLPWRELLDAATEGHDRLVPHPGGPAIENLDVPRIRSWRPGEISAEWTVPESLTNLRGELFGGYYGVLADVVLSFTAMTVVDDAERFKTGQLQISYFRPASCTTIRIEGTVINRSRTAIHAEASLLREDGKLLAKATATFAIVAAS